MNRKRIGAVVALFAAFIAMGWILTFAIGHRRLEVDDLMKIKLGMSKKEVEEILGEPHHAPGMVPAEFQTKRELINPDMLELEREGWVWESSDRRRLFVTFNHELSVIGTLATSPIPPKSLVDKVLAQFRMN